MRLRIYISLLFVFLAATASRSQVLRSNDFEAGTLSGFELQAAQCDSLTIARDPTCPKNFVGKSLLRNTDPKVSKGYRAEFVDHEEIPLNTVHWYGLSLYTDEHFTCPIKRDGIVYQFHQQANTGSPVLAFRLVDSQWWITSNTSDKRRTLARIPFLSQQWNHWVLRVKWSPDATGEWTIWLNGREVISETGVRTTYPTETTGPYIKFGQYHTVDEVDQNTVYFDNYVLAGPGSDYFVVALNR